MRVDRYAGICASSKIQVEKRGNMSRLLMLILGMLAAPAFASAPPSCGSLEGLAADAADMHPHIPGSFYLRDGVRVDFFATNGARVHGILDVRHVRGGLALYWVTPAQAYQVNESIFGAFLSPVTSVPAKDKVDEGTFGMRSSEPLVTGCPAVTK